MTLVTMLPVAIGGMIAIVGGLATGLLNHLLNRRSDRKERRRKKLEEMVELIYTVEVWLERHSEYHFFSRKDALNEAPPIERLRTICTLEFPEIKSDADNFTKATIEARCWVLADSQSSMESGVVYSDVRGPLILARDRLIKHATEVMRKLD